LTGVRGSLTRRVHINYWRVWWDIND
jgi:hypothetical protein